VCRPFVLQCDIVTVFVMGSVTLLSEILSLAGKPDEADITATVGFFLQAAMVLLIPFLQVNEETTVNHHDELMLRQSGDDARSAKNARSSRHRSRHHSQNAPITLAVPTTAARASAALARVQTENLRRLIMMVAVRRSKRPDR
jgi:hypothetical protein